MDRAMLIANSKNGAWSTYHIVNLRFYNVPVEAPFRFTGYILDFQVYFGLYTVTLHVRTDPVLIALAFKRCREVNWGKPATKEGFHRFGFISRKGLWLEKESVQVGKRSRNSRGSYKPLHLPAAPMFLRTNR